LHSFASPYIGGGYVNASKRDNKIAKPHKPKLLDDVPIKPRPRPLIENFNVSIPSWRPNAFNGTFNTEFVKYDY
jgi:hypothetical protein